jgi:hypothetical protein
MTPGRYVSLVILPLMVWLVVGAWRVRRKRVTVGPAPGAMGNLPDLEEPRT